MDHAPIKLLLVEDHMLTRQSLAFGLKKLGKFQIVGEAANGKEAVSLAHTSQPDIILMDIMMPVINGLDATQEIKSNFPDTKIIMLTSYGEEEKVLKAFNSGADGYCMKDIKLDRLASVIEMVCEGTIWLDPAIAQYILRLMPQMTETALSKKPGGVLSTELSERETEVLALMAEGMNNKDIADRLCISIHTVKNHVKSIIKKLAVEDRTQAAVMALKKGLI